MEGLGKDENRIPKRYLASRWVGPSAWSIWFKDLEVQGTSSGLNGLEEQLRASLVAQWLRICLLMQGTRVRALVWEDPTCHGATGPVSHNY